MPFFIYFILLLTLPTNVHLKTGLMNNFTLLWLELLTDSTFWNESCCYNATRLKFLFDNFQSHARWLTRESYKYHLKVLNSFVKLFTTVQPCLYSHTFISLSNPYFYNLYTSSTCLTHLWFNSFGVFSVWSFDTCSL